MEKLKYLPYLKENFTKPSNLYRKSKIIVKSDEIFN